MTDIWVVLVEDRHTDVDALPFSSEEAAVAEAQAQVDARHSEDIEVIELTDRMIGDGWVFNVIYSCEGDNVRVVKRELDRAL